MTNPPSIPLQCYRCTPTLMTTWVATNLVLKISSIMYVPCELFTLSCTLLDMQSVTHKNILKNFANKTCNFNLILNHKKHQNFLSTYASEIRIGLLWYFFAPLEKSVLNKIEICNLPRETKLKMEQKLKIRPKIENWSKLKNWTK